MSNRLILGIAKIGDLLLNNHTSSFFLFASAEKSKNLRTERRRAKVFRATFSRELLLCVIF